MQKAKLFGVLGLLSLTWLMVFFSLTLLTALNMAPWDTAVQIPEAGTWQRTLNDFFAYSAGQYLLSIPVVVLSMVAAWRAIHSEPARIGRMAAGNAVFIVATWAAMLAAWSINNHVLFPYPPVLYDPNYRGFHRSVLPMSVLLASCAIWFAWQKRGSVIPTLGKLKHS